MKHRGKEFVSFNLPAAPEDLLHGVKNDLDPRRLIMAAHGAEIIAHRGSYFAINATVTTTAAEAALVIGGPFLAVPVAFAGWFGSLLASEWAGQQLYEYIAEENPRILESDERLHD